MISKIKDRVNSFFGKNIRFRYNGSRNQIDEFYGVICGCYKYIFIIDVDGMKRSFSYSDVLIGSLEIDI